MSGVVSFVITAHNAETTIGATLRAVHAQRLSEGWRRDIVVVDDRSSDGTAEMAQALSLTLSDLRVFSITSPPAQAVTARQAALDVAVRAALGDPILVLDADALPPPSWAARMIDALSNADLVASPLVFRPAGHSTVSVVLAALQTVDSAHYLGFCRLMRTIGRPGGACFGAAGFRRSLYESVGGFAGLGFTLLEDLAFARAAHHEGWRVRVLDGRPGSVRGAASISESLERTRRVSAHGGPSWLAAALGAWGALLLVLAAAALLGFVPPALLAARWLTGLAWTGMQVARTRAWIALPYVAIYEPVTIAVALYVALVPSRPGPGGRTGRGGSVRWGGLEYARRAGAWGRVDSSPAR